MDGDDPRVVQQVLRTSNTGLAMYQTSLVNLKFKITLGGYNVYQDSKNRLTYCSDPTRCVISFPISKKLKGDAVHPEGCFFTAKPNMGVTFEMRAVLTWNENPSDLDIWVRNVGCSEDTRKRYLCWKDDEPQYREDENTCSRYRFRDGNTRALERGACATKVCQTKTTGQAATVFSSGGTPQCSSNYVNDFPKWVFWKARMMDRMDLRIGNFRLHVDRPFWEGGDIKTSGSVVRSGDAGDWRYRTSHWIVLDVDQTRGKGPETVTFHNVPPGTYQIAVDQFPDRTGNSIKEANPEVKIYLGSNAVTFLCSIPPECRSAEKIWSVVDIVIKADGQIEKEGVMQNKYSVRLLDDASRMAPLERDTAPTSDRTDSVDRSGPPCSWRGTGLFGLGSKKYQCDVHWDDYYGQISSYTDDKYAKICRGSCVVGEGTNNIGFDSCLDHR